jgi:hypothetical protein
MIPRSDALRAQRRSAGLLVFLSMDPATVYERGSKYLEYLGAGRRMLVFGPDGSAMRETIENLGGGFFASDEHDAERALCALYECYRRGEYRIVAKRDAVQTSERLAEEFARCLNAVTLASSKEANGKPTESGVILTP